MFDIPEAGPPHENQLRKWLAEHSHESMEYRAFRTLAEARTRADAVAVLDLDEEPFGPLATFPARRIEVDEAALARLHRDLGAILARLMGPEAPPVEGRVRYETIEALGSMMGSVATSDVKSRLVNGIVLHEGLRGFGLEPDVEAVFLGVRVPLGPDALLGIDRRLAWREAVARGDVAAVRGLIDQGVPVDAEDRDGESALFLAARDGDAAMVRLLLERGADPNRSDARGRTPMTMAATRSIRPGWSADDEVARLLLAAGGRYGLREAAVLGDVELARRILDADPTIDVSGDAGLCFEYPFLMVAAGSGRLDMTRFLLDRGADVDGIDDLHQTALTVAAADGRADVVALLLDRGADLDHVDWNETTPLAVAASEGRADVVRLLLDRGARRTLIDAILLNDPALVAELSPAGEEDGPGIDQIFHICERNVHRLGVDVLRPLLAAWSKADARPRVFGGTVLHEAAAAGRLDVTRLLLEFGFDPGQPDDAGATPAIHAERAGHVEIAELLRSAANGRGSIRDDRRGHDSGLRAR